MNARAVSKVIIVSFSFNFNASFFSFRFACQSNSPLLARASRSNAASRKISGSTTASTAPISCAFSGVFSVPPAIHSSALSAPTNRGRREVPPNPGSKPSFTSGSPTLALVEATRYVQARPNSKPPPSAYPLIAQTLGYFKFSRSTKTC